MGAGCHAGGCCQIFSFVLDAFSGCLLLIPLGSLKTLSCLFC
ncbi:hypothetical protein GCWU000324_00833 [Kingella oralis ATCC 51147]|uniref:Uncharacterized protein n=1 Tax=Kingella oralis ATCC 51147 TaxID=629741 RepID=C4GFB6_9NEIS|nr:hypothetical protein GCWU000324_00833 [Kingella oralis ATCC 51147]